MVPMVDEPKEITACRAEPLSSTRINGSWTGCQIFANFLGFRTLDLIIRAAWRLLGPFMRFGRSIKPANASESSPSPPLEERAGERRPSSRVLPFLGRALAVFLITAA